MRLRLVLMITTAALPAGAMAMTAGTASTPPITGGVLGTGGLTYKTATVHLSASSGYVMEWAKVAPGASFGWHFHLTAVAVAVTGGTFTLYDSKDPTCAPKRFTEGQGFIEPAGHIHMARNEGKTPVTLYVTYIGVKPGLQKNPTPLDRAAKSPGNCPTSIK